MAGDVLAPAVADLICLSVGTFGSASTSGIGRSQPGLSLSAAPAVSAIELIAIPNRYKIRARLGIVANLGTRVRDYSTKTDQSNRGRVHPQPVARRGRCFTLADL